MKKVIAVLFMLAVFALLSGGTAAVSEDAGTLLSNDKAKVDVSNLSDGYIRVAYTGGGSMAIKVLVTDSNRKVQYKYNLNNKGEFESFPLSEGNGTYSVDVYTNITGTRYALAFSTSFEVELSDAMSPFLASNQYVDYAEKPDIAKKAESLTRDLKTDIEKIRAVYNFVVKEITYDYDRAKAVTNGTLKNYLPDVDDVLKQKKGICFDYAAVIASMLRMNGIPCRMVLGYSGKTYHAWIDVYTSEKGWVNTMISFEGDKWRMMDPTYASTGKQSRAIMRYINNPKNYSPKYYY
ncbi:MAG: transglutaminase-like domain-containing protein [Oscillospiraceae bacterium]|jgi:hypothetical protein|nr:transglutaminase-like domain-containing protein [Oscillospiraceae bacterium]